MPNRLVRPAAGACATGVLAALATMSAAPPATAAPGRVTPAPASARLFTLNGSWVLASRSPDGRTVGRVLPAPGGSPVQSLMTLTVGASSYAFPAAALPYLGRGLSPDLFQLGALLRTERAGKLPVRLSYRGRRVPAVPGVTVTHASAGTAEGYLTQASAVRFGSALARQDRAGQAGGRYGADGLFARGTSISLAGEPGTGRAATAPATASKTPKQLLKVTASNLAGKPDNGDAVLVANADNSNIFGQNPNLSVQHFSDGVVTYHVPAGPYWAIGIFGGTLTHDAQYYHRLAVLPQFSVTKSTTVHIAERTANSKITMVTPRPATPVSTNFTVDHPGQTGPPIQINFSNDSSGPVGSGPPMPPLWVSPTTRRPTAGGLHVYASQQLAPPSTPAARPGSAAPYWYAVEYRGPNGIIPAQHYRVRNSQLGTVSERYYQASPQRSLIAIDGSLVPSLNGYMNPSPLLTHTPGTLTAYLGGNVPDMTWGGYDITLNNQGDEIAGQDSLFVPHPRRSHTADDWNAYPLHPGVNDNPEPDGWANGMEPSASRIGNTLLLNVTAVGDNEPGHLGIGFGAAGADKVTGRYVIDQNGKQIAGGVAPAPPGGSNEFSTKATLSPQASVVSFGLTVHNSGPAYPLSVATHTVWTWHSSRQPGVRLPGDWYCESTVSGSIYKCAVQPMMTLRYAVRGLSLAGQAPAGRQVVDLTVGHLQLVKPIAVTKATMAVSVNGGKTWRQAKVTGRDGHYRAMFDAPAGAYVMTRSTATDAAGGSVAETITRAYRVAS